MNSVMANYTEPEMVKFFHSWPHISFSFKMLEAEQYNYDNSQYLESLAMVALMAIVWLVITMIVFAIYFCCLRGRAKPDEKYNANGCYCSVCVLTVFLILTLGAIGVAVYGNMQSKDGLTIAAVHVKAGNKTLYTISDEVTGMLISSSDISNSIEELKDLRDSNDLLSMEEMAGKARETIQDFAIQLHGIEDRLGWSIQLLVVTEHYRNIITFALLGMQVFVCFLGLIGLCCRSKCTLIVTIVLGMICISVTYFYLGINLLVSVGVSDFCVNPYTFIYNQTVEKRYMSKEAADYFIKCNVDAQNPFADEFEDSKALIKEILVYGQKFVEKHNLTDVEKEYVTKIETDIQDFQTGMDWMNDNLNCDVTKQVIEDFVPAICVTTVEGFFAIAAAMFGVGVCMSFALCAAAKSGKRYGKDPYGSDTDVDLEFHDPFLPRTTRYNNGSTRNANITRTNNPIYATTASSNSNYGVASNTLSFFRHGSDDDISLIETPPPYSPPHPTSRYVD